MKLSKEEKADVLVQMKRSEKSALNDYELEAANQSLEEEKAKHQAANQSLADEHAKLQAAIQE